MKTGIVLGVIIALLVTTGLAGEINGQVFIVTRGGNSIKLGLVTVSIYERTLIDDFVNKKKADALPIIEYFTPWHKKTILALKDARESHKKISNEWIHNSFNKDIDDQYNKSWEVIHEAETLESKIQGYIDYASSGMYYFSDLPKEVKSAKTDADGKFTLSVPSGKYAIAACSTRHAGDNFESYYWMVAVTVDANQIDVMLSNDNLSCAASKESLIQTDDRELSAIKGAKAGGIDGLIKIVEAKKREQEETREQLKIQSEKNKKAEQERQKKIELENYRCNPALAQNKAVELYPDLGVQGSALNTEFLARAKRYRSEKPDFFTEPDWPIRLAKEISGESH